MNISKYVVAISACIVSVVIAAVVQGCATGAPQYSETPAAMTSTAGAQARIESRPPPPAGSNRQQAGVTGVWQGESRANCNIVMMADVTRCGAVNAITFTLLQDKANVSGYYRCAYGNMNCRNMNETGRIATGKMSTKLLRMRVMMPDGSDCLFNGWPRGDAMRGSYSCLQGGGLVEQGLWNARRSF